MGDITTAANPLPINRETILKMFQTRGFEPTYSALQKARERTFAAKRSTKSICDMQDFVVTLEKERVATADAAEKAAAAQQKATADLKAKNAVVEMFIREGEQATLAHLAKTRAPNEHFTLVAELIEVKKKKDLEAEKFATKKATDRMSAGGKTVRRNQAPVVADHKAAVAEVRAENEHKTRLRSEAAEKAAKEECVIEKPAFDRVKLTEAERARRAKAIGRAA